MKGGKEGVFPKRNQIAEKNAPKKHYGNYSTKNTFRGGTVQKF